jgi:hypothetical protein
MCSTCTNWKQYHFDKIYLHYRITIQNKFIVYIETNLYIFCVSEDVYIWITYICQTMTSVNWFPWIGFPQGLNNKLEIWNLLSVQCSGTFELSHWKFQSGCSQSSLREGLLVNSKILNKRCPLSGSVWPVTVRYEGTEIYIFELQPKVIIFILGDLNIPLTLW